MVAGRSGSRPTVRSARGHIAVVICALALSACDLFLGTAFPPFLNYVSAEIDLGSRLPDDRVPTDAAVLDTLSGERFLALYVGGSDEPDAFFVLDLDLGVRVAERSRVATATDSAFSFDGYTISRPDGAIQRGNLVFDPATNLVTNDAFPDLSLYPEPPRTRFPIPGGFLELVDRYRVDRLDATLQVVDSFDLFHDSGDPGEIAFTVDPSGSAAYLLRVDAGVLYKVDPWW